MAQANSGEFRSPDCTLAFSDGLFELKSVDGKKFNYSCTLIFPNKDKKILLDKVRSVVGMKWGDKGQAMFDRGLIKSPLLDGDGPSARNKQTGDLYNGFGPDVFFIRANAQEDAKPHVYFRSKHVQADKEDIYSGCIGFAVLNAYTWENQSGGNGVSFGIRAFQKLREGDSLGGRAPFNPDKWIVELNDEEDVLS
jgi:hypothetical protein